MDFKIVCISEKSENRPANIHLELANQNLLKVFKRSKVNTFNRDRLIILVTLSNEHFFESRDVQSLKIFFENNLLEVSQLFIREQAVAILVTNAEYPQQGSLKLYFYLLG